MILYHVSPAANRDSIAASGVLTEYSQGKLPLVWLVSESRVEWAIRHTRRRHLMGEGQVDVWRVKIGRAKLRRTGRRGRWATASDCPPVCISILRTAGREALVWDTPW